jgi:predicted nucleotidyltransferase
MGRDKILEKLKELKTEYEKEGFIILGIFGSYVRGGVTEESDLDILYTIDDKFSKKYGGLKTFGRLSELEQEISIILGKKIDLVYIEPRNPILKEVIKRDALYF